MGISGNKTTHGIPLKSLLVMGEGYGEQMILLTRNFFPLGDAYPEKKGRLSPRRAPKERGKPQKDRGQARNDKKAIKSKISTIYFL